MRTWRHLLERFGNWELWPFNLIYAPIGPRWLYYAARARSFWWFTPSNPTLTFAGFEGEGKKEMYDLLPPELYPPTIYVEPAQPFEDILGEVTKRGLQYPLCVKPQVGLKGLLFRKINNVDKLREYHRRMPFSYLIQPLVESTLEVSVFYHRYPEQQKGIISGFIQKEMLHVFGDGRSSLLKLIAAHPKARHRLDEMRVKHEDRLHDLLPAGEKYILTHAANLNRGASFTNLHCEIDDQLLDLFDPLRHRCQWFYGRYDIKCDSLEELKAGRFTILEFNGAGAEPNHVYNAGFSWRQALAVFGEHWRVLFEIGRYNHRHKGVRYWGNREGYRWLRQARRHGQLLEKYDLEIVL